MFGDVYVGSWFRGCLRAWFGVWVSVACVARNGVVENRFP